MLIREITAEDADAAAALTGELGYPVSSEVMKKRIEAMLARPDHTAFVACIEGQVVGWIDIAIVYHLQSDPRTEIGGFVVSSHHRSQGVGHELIRQAEQWSVDQGLKTVVVRSQITREKAHRFYLREGYERTKTSAVFTKHL